MKIIDIFVEQQKHKFLNSLIKIQKGYDLYLGFILDEKYTEDKISIFQKNCEIIFDKSKGNVKLLNIFQIDNQIILLFEIKTPPHKNIVGIINSIAKYLQCEKNNLKYIKQFKEITYNPWGEQQYHYITTEKETINLKYVKED